MNLLNQLNTQKSRKKSSDEFPALCTRELEQSDFDSSRGLGIAGKSKLKSKNFAKSKPVLRFVFVGGSMRVKSGRVCKPKTPMFP